VALVEKPNNIKTLRQVDPDRKTRNQLLMNAQNKTPEAIKLLNNALEKNKKNIAIHFKLASIYQQQNDIKQAETHYKQSKLIMYLP